MNYSNRPQESRWNRNKHKSPVSFNDIRNNNRDINVCNCTNESADRNADCSKYNPLFQTQAAPVAGWRGKRGSVA